MYVYVFLTFICVSGVTKGALYMDSIKNCEENPDYEFNATVNFKTEKGLQYMDSDMNFGKPLGDENLIHVTIFTTTDGVKYHALFKLKEKMCVAIKRYLGQLGYDFLMNAHIRPGTCPYPKGNYHIRNFPLDFSRMPFATFPGGKMRFQLELKEIETDKLIGCLLIDARME